MVIEPIPGEATRFLVQSESRSGIAFVVDLDYEGRPACGCEQYMVRGIVCKHIKAVQAVAWRGKLRGGN